jgi:hypothetical protein
MTPTDRPRIFAFLTGSKIGRTILFSLLLGGLFLVTPFLLSRRPRPAPGPMGPRPEGGGSTTPRDEDLPPSPTGFGETLTLGQEYDSLIHRWGGDLTSAKDELEATRRELDQIKASLQAERSTQQAERRTLDETIRQLKDGLVRPIAQASGRDPSSPPSPSGSSPGSAGSAGAGLRSLDFSPRAKDKDRPHRSVRIPTASGARATIQNGVFAPVSGEPSPVRLRLDQAVLGPNQARVPLANAYLIGKAMGDPNAVRVTLQIDRLSFVRESGDAVETKALGFVVGDDGLEGVPGRYEWRAWEFIPLALGAGGLQGMSGAFAQAQTTQTLTPLGGSTSLLTGSATKLAEAQAAAGASGKLGDLVAERMKEIRPAVSIPAGQQVTVVFLEGVTLEGVEAQEFEHEKAADPFRGLDPPR